MLYAQVLYNCICTVDYIEVDILLDKGSKKETLSISICAIRSYSYCMLYRYFSPMITLRQCLASSWAKKASKEESENKKTIALDVTFVHDV